MQWNLKTRFIVLGVVLLVALLFLVPTAKIAYKSANNQEITPDERAGAGWISKPIALGLDLSGGVELVYRVEVDEAVQGRLQANASNIRSLLNGEKIAVRRAIATPDKKIEITLVSDRLLEKAKTLIAENYSSLQFVDEKTDGPVVLRYELSPNNEFNIRQEAVTQAVENLRARVDQFGVTEPIIQKVDVDRIKLQMPGVKDIESVKKIVGKVAKMEFRFLPRPGTPDFDTVNLKDRDGNPVKVENEIQMSGDMVEGANVEFGEYGKVEVTLRMTPEGAKVFSRVSGENIGRQLAIILDGIVYSSPNIESRIPNGNARITGQFTMQEAKELALVLKAGALPASLTILSENNVGATLGQDAIEAGVKAILIGFALILIFMICYYKKAGIIASVILGLNIILVCALLSMFGATLTLPGLAGLALTVGMAVDANVIIFERIRDELRNGNGRDTAVALGFEKALSAIVDSNLTTLVTAILLYYFGTGPVRGFAVTLGIGVVTTLFCGTFASRTLFDWLPLKSRKAPLSI